MLSLAACEFPARLHPISQQILDMFVVGEISTAFFQRTFSLPNSDYIPLAACIAHALPFVAEMFPGLGGW